MLRRRKRGPSSGLYRPLRAVPPRPARAEVARRDKDISIRGDPVSEKPGWVVQNSCTSYASCGTCCASNVSPAWYKVSTLARGAGRTRGGVSPLFEISPMNESQRLDHEGSGHRSLLLVGLVLLLASVTALSAQARQPYLSRYSTSWRTSKSSRMNDERLDVSHELRRTDSPSGAKPSPRLTVPLAFPPLVFRKLPVALAVHHFRSPPAA